jgi:hypothetical protein
MILIRRPLISVKMGSFEFEDASEALGFAKRAFPMLAGQGLEARLWGRKAHRRVRSLANDAASYFCLRKQSSH